MQKTLIFLGSCPAFAGAGLGGNDDYVVIQRILATCQMRDAPPAQGFGALVSDGS